MKFTDEPGATIRLLIGDARAQELGRMVLDMYRETLRDLYESGEEPDEGGGAS
jgi:hypothetical protein